MHLFLIVFLVFTIILIFAWVINYFLYPNSKVYWIALLINVIIYCVMSVSLSFSPKIFTIALLTLLAYNGIYSSVAFVLFVIRMFNKFNKPENQEDILDDLT